MLILNLLQFDLEFWEFWSEFHLSEFWQNIETKAEKSKEKKCIFETYLNFLNSSFLSCFSQNYKQNLLLLEFKLWLKEKKCQNSNND